jgi:multidrug resistance efflux pump
VKRDTIVAILVVVVIAAAMVAFVWWRSTKSLMSTESPDRAQAMVVVSGASQPLEDSGSGDQGS